MAWDEFERNGRRLASGDEPMDELAIALRRIASAYQERFSRLPFVDEVLITLERTLAANPDRFVEDPVGMETARFECIRPEAKPRQRIDVNAFEGYYADDPPPGHYGIERRGGQEVIKIPRLEVENRVLNLDYRILDPAIDDDTAVRLIKRTLLREFSGSFYADKADEIVFDNLDSGRRERMPYEEA